MRRLLRLGLLVLVAYAGVCALLRWQYRWLLYPARGRAEVPVGVPGMARWDVPGGTFALFLDAPSRDAAAAPVVAVWHGNGGVAGDLQLYARDLRDAGLATLLVEYPGFPGTAGETSEEGIHAGAEAALQLLAERVGPRRVVLQGMSLGSGVALRAATRPLPGGHEARGLHLHAPYTSVAAAGARRYWFLPVEALLPDRFDSLARAGEVRVPTLVVHGDRDELIPLEMGRAVAAAVPGASLRIVQGAGHNDLLARDGAAIVAALVRAAYGP